MTSTFVMQTKQSIRRNYRGYNKINQQRQYCSINQTEAAVFYNFDDEITNNLNHKMAKRALKQYQRRLIACNGDCGSTFSLILDCWIHGKSVNTLKKSINVNKMIKNTFWCYGSPLRNILIYEMRQKQIFKQNAFYQYMYNKIRDKNCFIEGNEWVHKIKILLCLLSFDHIDLLQKMANHTCKIPKRSLLEEIDAFHCNIEYNLRQKLRIIECMIASPSNNGIKQALLTKKKLLQQNIVKTQSKMINMEQITDRLIEIKQSVQYHIMKQKNLALSNLEILSIMLYCNYDIFGYKMRESHREQHINSCEWKTLFYHLNSAITKIFHVFHFQNKTFYKQYIIKRKPRNNKLFRGIYSVSLNCKYSQNISLYTMTSFTEKFGIAKGFTYENGMVLTINDAFKAIYNGDLKAADVSWISNFNENEWIVCPTKFGTVNKIQQNNKDYFRYIRSPHLEIYEANILKCVCDSKSCKVLQRIMMILCWYNNTRKINDKSDNIIMQYRINNEVGWDNLLSDFNHILMEHEDIMNECNYLYGRVMNDETYYKIKRQINQFLVKHFDIIYGEQQVKKYIYTKTQSVFYQYRAINSPKPMLSITYLPPIDNAKKSKGIGKIGGVLICGTVATGGAIGSVIGAAPVPITTYMGSQVLGSIALSLGLVTAPAAPILWPSVAIGAAIGGMVGYAGSKLWSTSVENENINDSLYSVEGITTLTITDENNIHVFNRLNRGI